MSTHVSQIKDLEDGTAIKEIEFELFSLGDKRPGKQAGWASTWLGKAKDGDHIASVTFAYKKGDPSGWVGKRIHVVAGKDVEGNPSGIKTKANGNFMNLHITDSAKVTVAGDSQPFAPSSTSSPSPESKQASRPTSNEDPEKIAKHLATEWVTVYDWTAPIFEARLSNAQVKECVTGIVIEMRRAGHQILKASDNWRAVAFKDEKLGDFKPERLKDALIKVWRGAKVSDAVKDALNAASKEPEYAPSVVFKRLLESEGIDDDESVNTVLLREFKDPTFMTSEEFITAISTPKLIDDIKTLSASKHSSLDDDDALSL